MRADPLEILGAARSMLGTPFHHQGRLPGVGLDCAGLIVCAFRAVGVELIDLQGYGRRTDELLRMLHLNFEADAAGGPGWVRSFWVGRPGRVRHAAIDSGDGRIIHTIEGGRMVEEDAGAWAKRRHWFWRLPEASWAV